MLQTAKAISHSEFTRRLVVICLRKVLIVFELKMHVNTRTGMNFVVILFLLSRRRRRRLLFEFILIYDE